ncbi:MAG: hypothetical protein QXS23_00155 [Desulfurococcaceae archaeon]
MVKHVFSSISRAVHELRRSGCKISLLNDIAVIVYGVVKPLEEVRIMVSADCVENALDNIMKSFNVFQHRFIAEKRLREHGVVAVSTIFYPLLVIELARSYIDEEVLANTEIFEISGYEIPIPRIEHLIAKMLSLGMFPYNVYAYTLLFSWIDNLDHSVLAKLIKSTGINIENFVRNLEDMVNHLDSFQPIRKPQGIDRFKALLKST